MKVNGGVASRVALRLPRADREIVLTEQPEMRDRRLSSGDDEPTAHQGSDRRLGPWTRSDHGPRRQWPMRRWPHMRGGQPHGNEAERTGIVWSVDRPVRPRVDARRGAEPGLPDASRPRPPRASRRTPYWPAA